MRKHILFITVTIAVALFSCNKNPSDIITPVPTGTPPDNSKIKSITLNGITTYLYDYDNTGNIVKVAKADGTPYYNYSYSSNTINEQRFLSNGSLQEDNKMLLNTDGLVEIFTNSLLPQQLIKYEYTSDKKIAKKTIFTSGILQNTTYFLYANENLVKDSTIVPGSPGIWAGRTYEYYTGIISSTENDNWGKGYWGKGNRNALKKVSYFDGTNSSPYAIQEYQTPELDSKTRIVKTSGTTNGTGAPAIVVYTYY